ncbi:MAG: tetratricopeptide repeat protein, partial [Pyrinomonadaceae bacterium]
EFLAFMERTPESVAEVERAVELDPLSLSTNTARAFPYLAAGQFERTIEKVNPALELEKDFPLARYYLGRGYDGVGRHKEAVAEYQKAIAASARSTYFASAMIYALVKSGQRAEAEKTFTEIQALAKKERISPYVLARSLAALGRKEQALDELEKALQERDGLLIVMRIDQNLDDLRNEPRYHAILKTMRF